MFITCLRKTVVLVFFSFSLVFPSFGWGLPNLTRNIPADWSGALLISSERNATRSSAFLDCQNSYLSWSIQNTGDENAGGFCSSVDVINRRTSERVALLGRQCLPSLFPNIVHTRRDIFIQGGTLEAGLYDFILNIDDDGRVAESNENDNSTRTLLSIEDCQYPNIRAPHELPDAWDDVIVANRNQNSQSQEAVYSCETSYFHFISANEGGEATSFGFENDAYIRNSNGQNLFLLHNWDSERLLAGEMSFETGRRLAAGRLSPNRLHQVYLEYDVNDDEDEESNENDNEVIVEFNVYGCNAPRLNYNSPSQGTRTHNNQIRVRGSCQDEDGDLTYAHVINASNNFTRRFENLPNGDFLNIDVVVPLRPGDNSIQIRCDDFRNTALVQESHTVTYSLDLPDLVLDADHINLSIPQGHIDQTQSFTISNSNNASADLTYSIESQNNSNWLALIKNGGNTDVFGEDFSLAPGESDRYTVIINTTRLNPNVQVADILEIRSNDQEGGEADINVNIGVDQLPFCDGACITGPVETFGLGTLFQYYSSDPVNTATGNYVYQNQDLHIAGRFFDLEFTRTYNSQDRYQGPLGFGWNHSYNIFLTPFQDGTLVIKWGDGHSETYLENQDGSFRSPAGVFSSLRRLADNRYFLRTADNLFFTFNTNGQLESILDRNSNQLHLIYDNKNRLERVEDGLGRFLNLTYLNQESLHIRSVTDSGQRQILFSYNNDDLVSYTNARGHQTAYVYDEIHQLRQITDPRGNIMLTNTYDDFSRITRQIDAMGRETQIAYESVDRPEYPSAFLQVTITDLLQETYTQLYDRQLRLIVNQGSDQNIFLYTYDNNKQRNSAQNPLVHQSLADYDNSGNLLSVTDANDQTTQMTYDGQNQLTGIIPSSGPRQNYSYDESGNIRRQWIESEGDVIEYLYQYNNTGQMLSMTNPLGQVTAYRYTNRGDLESVVDPAGGETRFTYDTLSRVTSVTSPEGHRIQYSYNENDQVVRIIYPDNLSENFSYDENGNLTRFVDRAGTPITYSWNENNFLTSIQGPLGVSKTYVYDELNRKISETNAEGGVRRFRYSTYGISSYINEDGIETLYDYNRNGNLALKTAPGNRRWFYFYNSSGQIIGRFDPLFNATAYTYDEQTNRLVSMRNAEDEVTRYQYDDLGHLIQIEDAENGVSRFSYDVLGQLQSYTNPNNQTTSFEYDSLGRLSTFTNPLLQSKTYAYDSDGNLTSLVDEEDRITRFTYDNLAQLHSVTYPGNNQILFTYDALGNRLSRRDSLGETTYSYDALSRMTSVSDPRGFDLSYAYDRNSRLTAIDYPGNRRVSYAYRPSGLMSRLTDWNDRVTTYDYDDLGRLSIVTYPNQFLTTYLFDDLDRLITLLNQDDNRDLLSGYFFELDRIGRRISVNKQDAIDAWIRPLDIQSNYDAADQLLSFGDIDLTYDLMGQLDRKSDEGFDLDYNYNSQNLLQSIQGPDLEARFQYDGDGARISMSLNDQETHYFINPNAPLSQVLAEANADAEIEDFYIYDQRGLISKISSDDSISQYFHFDALGSTVALSNLDGQVTDRYVYDSFGQLNRKEGETENPFQYVGQLGVQNDESGLYYMRARYYDPEAGRFVSRDPIGFDGGSNFYAYAGNNPVSYVDPSGGEPVTILAVLIVATTATAACYFGGINFNPDSKAEGERTQKEENADFAGGCLAGLSSVFTPLLGIGDLAGTFLADMFAGRDSRTFSEMVSILVDGSLPFPKIKFFRNKKFVDQNDLITTIMSDGVKNEIKDRSNSTYVSEVIFENTKSMRVMKPQEDFILQTIRGRDYSYKVNRNIDTTINSYRSDPPSYTDLFHNRKLEAQRSRSSK